MFPTLRAVLRLVLICLLPAALHAGTPPKMEHGNDKLGREYYLYLPGEMDPQRTYWLVAGIHGAGGNGKGAGGFADWVNLGNCIVVGPTFPDGYQGLEHDTARQLIELAETLAKTYRLHPRLFVAGFSGGAQFAHRFALRHPEHVIGCAAHSGGTWDSTLAEPVPVPFVVSCGQRDTDRAFPDAPLTRIEWAGQFADLLKKHEFVFQAKFWPDAGHELTPAARRLTLECYSLTTTGLTLAERRLLDRLIAENRATGLKGVPEEFARARVGVGNEWNNYSRLKTEFDERARQFVAEICAANAAPLPPERVSSSHPPRN